jgi:membrane protein DedA with SNARE-associated domain
VPGDLLIVYFGYRVVHTPRPLLGGAEVLATVVAAVLCGSMFLYVIAHRYRWLLRRFGRFLFLNERRLEWTEGWVRRHGALVIIPGRLIPGLRVPTTIVCGSFGVPLRIFFPTMAASALIWATLYFVVGAAGSAILESIQDVRQAETSEWLLPAILVAAVLLTLLYHWRPWRSTAAAEK